MTHNEATCRECGKQLTCAHCNGARGGKLSRRTITPEQQQKMQDARRHSAYLKKRVKEM